MGVSHNGISPTIVSRDTAHTRVGVTMQQEINDLKVKVSGLQDEVEQIKISHEKFRQETINSYTEKQDKMSELISKQTDQLTVISERYQVQLEYAQRNEERTQGMNKWLLGILWTLLSIVLVVVITASINAIIVM